VVREAGEIEIEEGDAVGIAVDEARPVLGNFGFDVPT
jgi:hypothetical protein